MDLDYCYLLDRVPNAILAVDQSLGIVYANSAAAQLTGRDASALVGRNVSDIHPPWLDVGSPYHLGNRLRSGEVRASEQLETMILHRDGSTLEATARLSGAENGVAIVALTDSRQRAGNFSKERVWHELELMGTITANLAVGVCALDRRGRIAYLNPAAETMLCRREQDIIGHDFHLVVHDGTYTGQCGPSCRLRQAIESGRTMDSVEAAFGRPADPPLPVVFSISTLETGQYPVGCVLSFHDMAKRLEMEGALRASEAHYRNLVQALQHIASHDPLTGLPNRLLFHDRLEQTVKSSSRSGTRFAILFLDLDRFKQVNDTLGHDIGDRALEAAGARVRSVLRESDTVARLGGDEFAAILPGADRDGAVRAARKVWNELERPLELRGVFVRLGCSIGIGIFPNEMEPPGLIRAADNAMYVAKRNGLAYAVSGESPRWLASTG